MPGSGADVEYQRLLANAGIPVQRSAGQDGASLLSRASQGGYNRDMLRYLSDYNPPASKVSTSKCVVSVVANGFDGWDFTPNLVSLQDLPKVADCNFVPENVWTLGAPYYWSAVKTGPLNSDGTRDNTFNKPIDATFFFEGQYLTFVSAFLFGSWVPEARIFVDDEEIGSHYLGTRASGTLVNDSLIQQYTLASGYHTFNLNFAKRGYYKIRIVGLLASQGGADANYAKNIIAMNGGCSIHKPSPRPVGLVLSDSYSESVPSNSSLNPLNNLTTYSGVNYINCAMGGSGIVNPSDNAPKGDKNFDSTLVMQALDRVKSMNPVIGIVNGSGNDLKYSQSQVAATMGSMFRKLGTKFPGVPWIWVGLEPQSYFKGLYDFETVIKPREEYLSKVALQQANVIGVVQPSKFEWLTGTGYINVPAYNGNQDFMVGYDAIHLSSYGTTYWARRLDAAIKSILKGVIS